MDYFCDEEMLCPTLASKAESLKEAIQQYGLKLLFSDPFPMWVALLCTLLTPSVCRKPGPKRLEWLSLPESTAPVLPGESDAIVEPPSPDRPAPSPLYSSPLHTVQPLCSPHCCSHARSRLQGLSGPPQAYQPGERTTSLIVWREKETITFFPFTLKGFNELFMRT